MPDHPIETLMKTAMESIKGMIDVNTIVGDPVETPDGNVIMPISRVSCGFAAGGADYLPEARRGTGPVGGGNAALRGRQWRRCFRAAGRLPGGRPRPGAPAVGGRQPRF